MQLVPGTRLTKYAHFLAVKTGLSLEKLVELYIDQIVKLHGVPVTIVSDRDSRFVAHFWRSLHKALGTKLTFSTAFHPQTELFKFWKTCCEHVC